MLTTARIEFRIHRFEILVAVLACLVVATTAAIVSIHLVQANALVPAGCWDEMFWSSGPPSNGCEGPIQAFLAVRDDGAPVMTAMFGPMTRAPTPAIVPHHADRSTCFTTAR